jgi:hypothetical protein
MYTGNRVSQRFIKGLETFLEIGVEYKKPENMSVVHYIYCPCVDYCNEKKTRDIEEIREHFLVETRTTADIKDPTTVLISNHY